LARAARAAAVTLAAGCAACSTILLGGVALADDPPPSPPPSISSELSGTAEPTDSVPQPPPSAPPPPAPAIGAPLHLELSLAQGPPGTSFTATATGTEACYQPPSVAASLPSVSFASAFGEETVTAYSGSASVTLTVPETAEPDAYPVTASCSSGGTPTDTATFTVTEESPPEPATLSLSPQQGTPGQAPITATTTGFDACLDPASKLPQPISWQWDGDRLETAAAGTDSSTVTFQVPAAASASIEHTVTASCGRVTASAPFTVVPMPTPVLTLDKRQGQRGSQLTADGTGFACRDGDVTLLWDGRIQLAERPSGTFSAQVEIPADAPVSQHTVVASCRNHPDITDSKSFMVTADTVGAAVPPALGLAPTRGAPGDDVHVTGERFGCTGSQTVELSWDGQPLGQTTADTSGSVDTSIKVPADAAASTYIVRASCAAGPGFATAGFTVVVAGTGIPPTGPVVIPPPEESGGIAIWVVLAIIAVVGVMAYRHWRKSQLKPPPHVYARASATNGFPLVSTTETPAHGQVAHALRVLLHADVGTQTISEVDSEHTTQ
jgi:hypothetical protein